jgi:hypothetical protein
MKLPAMNELLRIIAAAGITLLVVALAIMFFMWVFSSADREHRRVQPLAVSSSAERSRSISASWRSILRTSSPIIANITMMAVKATENPINILNRCLHSSRPILRAVAPGQHHPSAPGSASRPTVRPTSAEGRDPAGGTSRQSNRARQYPRTQGLFMLELGKGEGLRRRCNGVR